MNIKFCKWSEEIKILILVIENIFLRKLCKVYLIMGFYFVIKLMFDDIIRDVLIFFIIIVCIVMYFFLLSVV